VSNSTSRSSKLNNVVLKTIVTAKLIENSIQIQGGSPSIYTSSI